MARHHSEILVIGAGMAGLACTSALAKAGREVRVLDKGRGPGGRMAARRAEIGEETVGFDHGAQYFTARDPGFKQVVANWDAIGATARWSAAEELTGEPAWVGVPGMNGPIRAMAEGLDVRWGTRALGLAREETGWRVDTEEESFTARLVLLAVPAEQAHELPKRAAPALAATAGEAISEPCWAVMAAFWQPLDLAADVISDPDAPIAWAARNASKPGRGKREAWVIHASPARSRELLDHPAEEVAPLLLDEFFAQTGVHPTAPLHLAAHRWLYARPGALAGEPARFDVGQGIGIAGDYLHSPRVEGAWLSGRALAEAVLGASSP